MAHAWLGCGRVHLFLVQCPHHLLGVCDYAVEAGAAACFPWNRRSRRQQCLIDAGLARTPSYDSVQYPRPDRLGDPFRNSRWMHGKFAGEPRTRHRNVSRNTHLVRSREKQHLGPVAEGRMPEDVPAPLVSYVSMPAHAPFTSASVSVDRPGSSYLVIARSNKATTPWELGVRRGMPFISSHSSWYAVTGCNRRLSLSTRRWSDRLHNGERFSSRSITRIAFRLVGLSYARARDAC